MMKYILRSLILFLCACPAVVNAQLADPPIFIETIVHHGDYGEANHDLSGYVTYKVYVQFTAANNYLTSIFAAEGGGGLLADCIQDPDSTVFFNFDCDVFQHEIGGSLGSNQLCQPDFLGATSIFDSFLTIGQQCASDANTDLTLNIGECLFWENDFEGANPTDFYEPGSFFWDEYSISSIPTGMMPSLSLCDGNFRVFIGQFTTCGNMEGNINIQFETPNGVTNNQEFDIPIIGIHPCLNDPLDNTPEISLPCFAGESAELAIGAGGNDSVFYYLFNTANQLIDSDSLINGGWVIDNLPEGEYIIYMRDELDCRDTTEVFTVEFADPLELSLDLISDELCAGELAGTFEINCSGGTGALTINDQNSVNYVCGQILDGLSCINYTITASDENGCELSESIQIACPAALEYDPIITDVSCFDANDGVITGAITGGTGALDVTWTYEGEIIETLEGTAPINVNLSGLDGGQYSVSISDANGCELNGDFTIIEPEEIVPVLEPFPASCFGFCDGSFTNNSFGGSGILTTTAEDSLGNNVPVDQLCAGIHIITITDESGCSAQDTIDILQPTDITYLADTTNATCNQSCDGQVALNEVAGSFGGYTYSIDPSLATCAGTCSGTEVLFTDLCAGGYVVTITDQNGCTKNVDFTVNEPEALDFGLDITNVTCFSLNNGTVAVTEIIGGTAPFGVSLNEGDFFPFIPDSTFEDLIPGDYIIEVVDSNNCAASQNFTITEPDLLTITLDTTIACSCGGICDGVLQYLGEGGTPNYQYLLMPDSILGPGFGVVNGICAGDYEIFLIDANECTDSLEFTITEPDPLTIEVLLDAPTCTGMNDGSAEITVGGGTGELSFFVQPDDYIAEPIDSVTYGLSELIEDSLFLELSDENGCRIFDTLAIVPDIITDMILTMSQTPETCWNAIDGTATVAVQNGNPPLSYEWDDNLLQTTATAMGLAPNAEYTVRVTDDIGCNLTASVFVEANIGCFFIATAITPNGDGVNDSWVLGGFEYYPEVQVNVFNRWGQTVFSSTGYNAQWDGRFNGQLLPVADYYFTIDYAADKEVIMGTVTIKY